MDLMDSLKWVFFSQQLYRLAVFRMNANRSKLITDNTELLCSFLYVSLITIKIGYVGYSTFVADEDVAQLQTGKSKIIRVKERELSSFNFYTIIFILKL